MYVWMDAWMYVMHMFSSARIIPYRNVNSVQPSRAGTTCTLVRRTL